MIRETHYDHLFESQKQYRTILDCMSKPGITAMLDADINVPNEINKASVLVGFALMNSDVTFNNSYAQEEEINTYLLLNTSSSPAEAHQADFIFISGVQENTEAIDQAKSGLPEYPEHAAFVVVDTTKISENVLNKGVKITLEGPGVKHTKDVYMEGLSTTILDAIAEKNIEYPLGVDIIFTDKEGTILCMPRSNKFKYSEL
ncbi:phosphonate C-P lyase system protein PhnH [Flavobacteriaceae bacterium MHTCC 0001]